MKRSLDRILTTHVGSLPRPQRLLDMYVAKASETEIDAELTTAVAGVVARQLEAGIDVVNDGEYGKPTLTAGENHGHGTWALYVSGRLAGFELADAEVSPVLSRDTQAYPEFYSSHDPRQATHVKSDLDEKPKTWSCTGPVSYSGGDVIKRDLENLRAALGGHDKDDAFLPSVAPEAITYFMPNLFYDSREEYTVALGQAMKAEYTAIADAGFMVQIDDPILTGTWDFWQGDLASYLKMAAAHVELLNEAISELPRDRLRMHVCWGSWQGPHSTDLPLKEIVDLMLQVNVSAYSIEASNGRHEHEWRVWDDVKLPDDKILIPGVVSHKTSVVEHPQLVCDRIVRYAERVGKENVIAGTDCGLGGRISPDVAWGKLRSLSEGAELATAELW